MTAPGIRPPAPDPQVVLEMRGWDGLDFVTRYLRDLDHAAEWLLSPDFAPLIPRVRSITFRFVKPQPSAAPKETP